MPRLRIKARARLAKNAAQKTASAAKSKAAETKAKLESSKKAAQAKYNEMAARGSEAMQSPTVQKAKAAVTNKSNQKVAAGVAAGAGAGAVAGKAQEKAERRKKILEALRAGRTVYVVNDK